MKRHTCIDCNFNLKRLFTHSNGKSFEEVVDDLCVYHNRRCDDHCSSSTRTQWINRATVSLRHHILFELSQGNTATGVLSSLRDWTVWVDLVHACSLGALSLRLPIDYQQTAIHMIRGLCNFIPPGVHVMWHIATYTAILNLRRLDTSCFHLHNPRDISSVSQWR